jgi:LuxR family transcriptional regulator, maltose regulon positive regulatory protein
METTTRQPPPYPRLGADTLVPRASLLDLLEAAGHTTVVAVSAPPGYGKTTLLAQWADHDPRPFAWLTIDQHDNDPAVLLRDLAVTLDRIEPLDPALLGPLTSSPAAAVDATLPRLGSALSAAALPVVLVLDDLHLLQSRDCWRPWPG